VGAALTTPGRAGTARQRGSGKRDGEEYARNRRLKIPQNRTGPEPGGYGPGAARTRSLPLCWRRAGNSGPIHGWFGRRPR
jgi:hypothetical protein